MSIFSTISGLIYSIDSLSPRFESFPETKEPDPVAEEIRGLRDTPVGWDYGRGVVIEDTIVQKALHLYESTCCMGFKVKVFPRSDGGVTLSYSKGDNFLDIVINPNTTLSLIQEKGVGEDYEIVHEEEIANLDRAKTLLNLILSSECPSLELYMEGSTIRTSSGSKVIVSHHYKEEYPFSMPIVPYANQEQYVSTYDDSTNQQLVLQ